MAQNNGSTPGPRPGGLSLYANLLDPNNASMPGSISKAPVIFKHPAVEEPVEEAQTKKPQIDAATLRFQPTRRPQLAQPKAKPKTTFPKAAVQDTSNAPAKPVEAVKPAAKSTLADWTNAEDDAYYEREKAQRGGRKKRKKNREEQVHYQDWDDIYDPTRPNSYEEYKHSDEKIREVREWKDRLYAHRMARQASEKDSDSEEDYKPRMGNQFAPPSNYSFAPPPIDSASPPPPPPAEEKPDSDTYSPPGASPPPPPPPQEQRSSTGAGTISRAPVRYNLPAAPADIPKSQDELDKVLAEEEQQPETETETASDEPRSLRPGQRGFAERLMSKYGWSKGTGLGADGTGITTALRMQVEKQKKKEGESTLGPRGKIVGGKKKEGTEEKGKFGVMSSVVVLRGMVDGMDLDEEVEGSGGLMQEIGEECGEKYGRVERVFIDRTNEAIPKVFVKFTAELSALRAVNALEGRIFNGNTIQAMFYDTETFEKGVYDK